MDDKQGAIILEDLTHKQSVLLLIESPEIAVTVLVSVILDRIGAEDTIENIKHVVDRIGGKNRLAQMATGGMTIEVDIRRPVRYRAFIPDDIKVFGLESHNVH